MFCEAIAALFGGMPGEVVAFRVYRQVGFRSAKSINKSEDVLSAIGTWKSLEDMLVSMNSGDDQVTTQMYILRTAYF